MNDNKDITSLGRYLNLLQEAIKVQENTPNRMNAEMCNKYYKLYSDEHIKLFGCKPESIQEVKRKFAK